MVKLLAERAFAKINLFLRITGRRADGYHELDSIFVPVSLSDRITIEVRPAPTLSITLRCNIGSLGDAQTNLAARAARSFLDEFAWPGRLYSAAYLAVPVTFTRPSTREIGMPM